MICRSTFLDQFLFFAFFLFPICGFSQQMFPVRAHLKLDYNHVNAQSERNKQLLFFSVSNTTVNDESYSDIAIDVHFRAQSVEKNIFSVALIEAKVKQQVLYRRFDVSEYLIPDLFSFDVEYLTGNKKVSMYFENVSVTAINELYFSYDSDRMQISDVLVTKFNYSDSLTAVFEMAIRKINDFHASKRLLEYLINQYKKQVDETDLVTLFNYWDISRKALKATIHFDTFFEESNLQEKKTFESLRDQLIRLNTRCNTLLHSELDKKERKITNTKLFIDAYFAHAEQLKINANKFELRDSEIFTPVAMLTIDDDFKAVLRRITVSQSLPFLENDLFEAIFNKARLQINESDYTSALGLLETLYCFDMLQNDEARVAMVRKQQEICKSGLLRDYFRIAARAVTSGNQSLTERYIQKAVNFYQHECITSMHADIQRESEPLLVAIQQKGAELLNTKRMYDAIKILEEGKQLATTFKNTFYQINFDELLRYAHHEVYLNILLDAQQHAVNGNTESAHVLIESALHYAQQNTAYITNTEEALALRRQIQQPFYDEMLENILTMAKKGDRQRALELLQDANQLSKEYGIETEINEESGTLVVAKYLVLNTLRSSYVKIWSNDLADAWRIYSEAKQLTDEFSLMNDEDIKREFLGFDKKVIERACLNSKLEFEDLMQTIEVKAEQQKFFELKQALNNADEIINQNRGCDIDARKLHEYRQRYSSFFEYETRYNTVLNILYSEGFKACIPHYLELDRELEQSYSENYKNVHKTLFDFIKEQRNTTLTLMALTYFLEEKDAHSLQKCMHLLIDQNFMADGYAELLSELGTFFAHNDMKNNTSILQYIPDNKYFKSFIRSYQRNFK